MKFVQSAEKLFVWVSSGPCIMVLPPHCFHTVFTLTPACDIGVTAGSDFWEEEMKTVSKFMLTGSIPGPELGECLVDRMIEMMRDFRVWVSWVEDIKREPSEKEKELMRSLAPLMKRLKEILEIVGEESSC